MQNELRVWSQSSCVFSLSTQVMSSQASSGIKKIFLLNEGMPRNYSLRLIIRLMIGAKALNSFSLFFPVHFSSLKRILCCCINWHFYHRESLFNWSRGLVEQRQHWQHWQHWQRRHCQAGFAATKNMHTYKSHKVHRRRKEKENVKTCFRNGAEKAAFQ